MLQHKNYEVTKLLCYMSGLGFKFDVLGGYPRDLYFNREPRDMDVCVYDIKSSTILFLDRIQKLHDYLHINNLWESEFATDSKYPSDRIYGGIKTTLNVDIIFWLDNFQTKEDVLSMFDFNINQFILGRDENTGTTVPRAWGGMDNFGHLTQLRNSEIMDERVRKITKLATYVNWKPLNKYCYDGCR